MERPGVVWVYSILVALGIIFNLIGAIITFTKLLPSLNTPGMTLLYFVSAIVYILLTIPIVMFLIKFFNLKKESETWLYISFGIYIVISLVNFEILAVALSALLGWAVWDYIRHKKINGKNVFT